jgi:serine/threonine protein kinase
MSQHPPHQDLLGQRIGDVRVTHVLHESRQGVVLLGSQIGVERQAVVKLLSSEQRSSTHTQRLLAEAATLGQMRHANIVTLYDVGQYQGQPYLVMEYIPGEPLSAVLAREGVLAPDSALGIIQQVTHALEEAHSHGILHHNLRLKNVMIESLAGSQQELAKVMNFSASRWSDGPEEERAAYSTPEEVMGAAYTARGELYVCGVLLYELLTGQLPYVGESPAALWDEIVSERPLPLLETQPALAAYPELQPLIDQFLSKKESLRPPDARSARLHLGQCLVRVQTRRALLGYERSSSFPVINTVESMPALPQDLEAAPPYQPPPAKRALRAQRVSSEDLEFSADSGLLAPTTESALEPVSPWSAPPMVQVLSQASPSSAASVSPPSVEAPRRGPWEEANASARQEASLKGLRWQVREEATLQALLDKPSLTLSVLSLSTQLPAEVLRTLDPALVTLPPSRLFLMVCVVPEGLPEWLEALQEVSSRHLLRVGVAFGRRLDQGSRQPPPNTLRMSLRAAECAQPGELIATRHAVSTLQLLPQFTEIGHEDAGRYSSFLRFQEP